MTDEQTSSQIRQIKKRQSKWRVMALLLLSLSMFGLTWLIIHKRLPAPAPDHVQQMGIDLVHEIMSDVKRHLWGGTQRAQTLLGVIDQLLEEKRIIFTNDIRDTGFTVRGPQGKKCIYIKVVISDTGQFQHLDMELLCDVVFHEALHVQCKQTNSIEQEADAFIAGLEAVVAFRDRNRPQMFHVEGKPVGQFVLEKYPELSRDAKYQPLATNLTWLWQQTGLDALPTESPRH
ncbi:MAG: hypothetical protein ACF8OB_10190 [Phycisphaeraceae bacterium JB051]